MPKTQNKKFYEKWVNLGSGRHKIFFLVQFTTFERNCKY